MLWFLKKLAQMFVAISAGAMIGGIAFVAVNAVLGSTAGFVAYLLVAWYVAATAGVEMGL